MYVQLQDCVDVVVVLFFECFECIEILGVDDEWFFVDCVGVEVESEVYVVVVQEVW